MAEFSDGNEGVFRPELLEVGGCSDDGGGGGKGEWRAGLSIVHWLGDENEEVHEFSSEDRREDCCKVLSVEHGCSTGRVGREDI